jgi:gas vesicle protein
MWRRKMVLVLAVAAIAAGGFIGQAISQESRPASTRKAHDREQMRPRMEEFRQHAQEWMKELLGVSDEEWAALQPKIEKVQRLNHQLRFGMMGGMFGQMGRGGEHPSKHHPEQPPGQPPEQPQGPPPEGTKEPKSDLQTKAMDLRKLLRDTDAKPEDLKTALTAYREARAKAAEELAKAQKELQGALTVRQEARLVLMGLLD